MQLLAQAGTDLFLVISSRPRPVKPRIFDFCLSFASSLVSTSKTCRRSLLAAHIDKINHDDPAEVPQADLAGDLLRRLQIVARTVSSRFVVPVNLPVLTSIIVKASPWSKTR